MKRLLYISFSPYDANFSSTIRNESLIEGFVKLGYAVQYITVESGNFQRVKDKGFSRGNQISLNLINQSNYINSNDKLRSLKYFILSYIKKTKSLKRLLYYVYNFFSVYEPVSKEFNYRVAVGNFELSSHYDYIISSSDPKFSHKFAVDLIDKKLFTYGRYIQYWGDPFLIDITKHSFLTSFFIKRQESFLMSRADKIVYTSPATADVCKAIYPLQSEKIYFIPTAVNFESSSSECFFNEDGPRRMRVCYAGSYYRKFRNLIPFYNASLKFSDSADFFIVGESDLAIESTHSIKVLGSESYSEKLERESDLIIVVLNKSGTQLPGKLYHVAKYMKPILVILDGEYSRFFKEFIEDYLGYFVCDNTVDSISFFLESFFAADYQTLAVSELAIHRLNSLSIAKSFLN